jgi:hypothetical protein
VGNATIAQFIAKSCHGPVQAAETIDVILLVQTDWLQSLRQNQALPCNALHGKLGACTHCLKRQEPQLKISFLRDIGQRISVAKTQSKKINGNSVFSRCIFSSCVY